MSITAEVRCEVTSKQIEASKGGWSLMVVGEQRERISNLDCRFGRAEG